MSSTANAQAAAQLPFLHHYAPGDDTDSPPSLTNSSESPHSTSEESAERLSSSSSSSSPKHNNVNDYDDARLFEEGAKNATSPNWDSVFGSAENDTEMVLDLANGKLNKNDDPVTMSDDAIFESMIQQEKFESSNDQLNEITPPQSAHPSASALSSRRNSLEPVAELAAAAQAAHAQSRVPQHRGSHYSHTSDADLASSSHVVVNPPMEALNNLQVHVHGVAFSGAKSRVETQIRLRVELVRPVPDGETSESTTGFERVGNFNHVKLPPLTGTKRRSKKHKQMDVEAERTLFMDAAVVCATPPHERVFVCRSCQQREKKRAQRRKSGPAVKVEEEQPFSLEDYQELGVDPNAPDAIALVNKRAEEEDEKRVVVFNCGDFVAFEQGACVLPTRITCYCRHHREKVGFCLIFTMRDFRGNLIATGSTPPIMITDDHKSVAAAAAAAAAAESSATSTSAPSTNGATAAGPSRSRAGSKEKQKAARRAQRSKPYGDTDERMASRSKATSPLSTADAANPDVWQAISALSGSPPSSSQTSAGVPTPPPHAMTRSPSLSASMQSPIASSGMQSPPPQMSLQQQPMQDWAAHMAMQGSISAQTLNINPQSVPGFDLNTFLQSIQRGQANGDQASVQHLMMLARSLPLNVSTANGTPIPSISKLIPGEGPTSGGIEVTVLGENFVDGLTCFFGDVPANSTRVWGSNTLLCILPPSASPGPVAVTVKGAASSGTSDQSLSAATSAQGGNSLQLFTYVDATDRALMELALQVVGLQMTGQMQSARDVAMRVVGSGPNQGMTRAHNASSGNDGRGGSGPTTQSRDAVSGMFANASPKQSFQDSVLSFLQTLDHADLTVYEQAICLANKQGHTLLHLAVVLGFQRLVVDLLQRGCPINARDNNGFTALHFAALHGRVTICKKLLSHGAAAEIVSDAGTDAIDVARIHEQSDIEALLDEQALHDEEEEEEEEEREEEEDDVDNDDESASLAGHDETNDVEVDEPLQNEKGVDDAMVAALVRGPQKESSRQERKGAGLKGLVSGGLDFTRFGMPATFANGFPLHAPVVSVFQMAMPSHSPKNSVADQASPSKEVSTWRHFIEESALWINPLSSPPPPAYDTLDAPQVGPSRFPPIAASARSQEKAEASFASPEASSSSKTYEENAAQQAQQSADTTATTAVTTSISTVHPPKRFVQERLRTRSLKDDRMLVYFWLPILVSVSLLVFFTKPSAVLSYGDMMSFMPF